MGKSHKPFYYFFKMGLVSSTLLYVKKKIFLSTIFIHSIPVGGKLVFSKYMGNRRYRFNVLPLGYGMGNRSCLGHPWLQKQSL